MSGIRSCTARLATLLCVTSCLVLTGCDRQAAASRDDDGETRKKKKRRADDDGDSDEKGEERDDRKVLKELEAWIQSAQHAVFVEGNAERYWAIYAKEGQVVTARGEQPHPYDYVIPAKRAEEYVHFRDKLGKVGALDRYEQRYEEKTQSLSDDKAVFQWLVHTSWKQPDGVHKAVFGERYTVLRDPDKERWRVSEKRNWTLSSTRPALDNELAAFPAGVETKLDDAFYAAMDAQVDRARLTGGAPLFWALSNAGRHPEAYQLAKSFVAAPGAVGEAFYLLGVAASRLNFGAETKAAFDRARALDPRIYPPRPWGPDPPTTDDKSSPLLDLMRPASAATL